jgi:nucleotide-binding universal stress UspA family protein
MPITAKKLLSNHHDLQEAKSMKPATAKTQFDNILFATDFSPAAMHAIPFVKQIARHFQSSLVAFYVKPPVVNPMSQPATWEIDIEAARVFDKEHREQLLDTFAGINTDVLIEEGAIQSSLESAIEKHNTDLVIIGTRGRTGMAKVLLGSVAEQIFRTVPCPVMTVGPHSDLAKANIREILFATDFASEAQEAAGYSFD